MAEVREITELFRLEKVLKSSPGGVVFRATDPATGRKVAIKLINRGSSPDQEACRRTFAEAVGTLQSLHLPAFPTVRDHGFTPDGTAFVVMDLVEGGPIEALVGAPPSRVLGLFGPVVDALEALAARGIAHHNLSPDNLLLVHGRSGEQVVVLGFGTAAFRPEGPMAARSGREPSFSFLAPELLERPGATGAADWRSDLYSLNLLVCHLLGAKLTPPDFPELELPPQAREGLQDAEALRSVLLSGLRHSPAQRPASYEAIRNAFALAMYGRVGPVHEPEKTEAFRIPTEIQPPAAPLTEPPPAERTMAVRIPPPAILTEPGPAPVLSQPGFGPEDDLSRTMPIQIQPVMPPVQAGEAVPTTPEASPAVAQAPAGNEGVELELETEPPAPVEEVLPLLVEEEPTAEVAAAVAPEPGVAEAVVELPASQVETSVPPLAEPPAQIPGEAPGTPADTLSVAQTLPLVPAFEPAGPPPPPPPPVPAPTPAGVTPEPIPRMEVTAAVPTSLPPLPPEPPGGVPQDEATGEPAAPSAESPETAQAPPPPPVPGKRKGVPLWPLFLLVPLALALVAGGVFVVGPRLVGALLPKPTPTPTPARPTPSPIPRPTQAPRGLTDLGTAEDAFRAGDFEGAREALDRIAPEDEDRFSRDDYDRLRALRDELASQRAGSLTKDLDRGIRNGNVELLKRTLAAFTPSDLAGVAGDRKAEQQLALARRAIEAQGQMLRASRERNNAEVIRLAGGLLEILPKCAQAADLRDRAAATMESDAEALVRGGQLDAGIARLDELRRLWADRPGLDRKIERYRNEVEADRRVAALLAEVQQAEQERKPERGLELLRGAPASEKWAGRLAEARERLERLLAELDKGSPSVQLRPGWKPEYEKGKPAQIPLKITDDYGVRSVSVRGRVEGTVSYTDIPVRRSGAEYTAEVPSAFHKNETIELYVTATDASGHTGQLGSADAPVKVKKKRWLF